MTKHRIVYRRSQRQRLAKEVHVKTRRKNVNVKNVVKRRKKCVFFFPRPHFLMSTTIEDEEEPRLFVHNFQVVPHQRCRKLRLTKLVWLASLWFVNNKNIFKKCNIIIGRNQGKVANRILLSLFSLYLFFCCVCRLSAVKVSTPAVANISIDCMRNTLYNFGLENP